jgi:hypothetical protein
VKNTKFEKISGGFGRRTNEVEGNAVYHIGDSKKLCLKLSIAQKIAEGIYTYGATSL